MHKTKNWATIIIVAVLLIATYQQQSKSYAAEKNLAGESLLINGDFSNGLDGWITYNAEIEHRNGALCTQLDASTIDPWDSLIFQEGVTLEPNTSYLFRFQIKADQPLSTTIKVGQNKSPFTSYLYESIAVGTAWQGHFFNVHMNETERISSAVEFQTGGAGAGELCIDNVSLTPQNEKNHGYNFVAYGPNLYDKPFAKKQLDLMRDGGTNSVAITVFNFQESIDSSTIYSTGNTEQESELRAVIQEIHNRGMSVHLRPLVDIDWNIATGIYRGTIGSNFSSAAEWDAWFSSYQSMINRYADLAMQEEVELFSVGTELAATSGQDDRWRALVDEIRERYPNGTLTYSANFDEVNNVAWWDAVDVIGVDAYYPLTNSNTPTMQQLRGAWSAYAEGLAALAQQFNRPVLFSEVGYSNDDGTNREPYQNILNAPDGANDLQEQADAYQAMFEVLHNQPWFAGLYVWEWSAMQWATSAAGGRCIVGHAPKYKPAENVLRQWFGADPLTMPAPQSAGAVDLYTESLNSEWNYQDWSWDTYLIDTDNSEQAFAGSHAIKVHLKNYGGFSMATVDAPIAADAFDFIEFEIKGDAPGNQQLWLYLNEDDHLTCPLYGETLSNEIGGGMIEGGEISSNEWRTVRIRLRDLGMDGVALKRISIKSPFPNQEPIFWLDNIRLLKAENNTTVPTATDTPTPVDPATDTPTDTPTETPTDTVDPTDTTVPTDTLTPTATVDTPTPAQTPTNATTPTPTATLTPAETLTDTPAETPTVTPTSTKTNTPTPTPADSAIIPSSRRIDWARDPGVIGQIDDHIPSNSITVQANGSDNDDDTEAFRAAINAVPEGGIIQIPSGTYYLSNYLQIGDRQVLRGSGIGSTTLVFTQDLVFGIEIRGQYPQQAVAIQTAPFGADKLVVAQTDSFDVGRYGLITKTESKKSQTVKVIAVVQQQNETWIQLEEPLNFDFSEGAQIQPFDAAEYAGVEELRLTVANRDVQVADMIRLRSTGHSWVRNVQSELAFAAHLFTRQTYHCEIRGSYFSDATGHHDGKQGYGIDLATNTTGCLVEDNELEYLRHSILLQGGASGNIVAFNHSRNPRHTNFGRGGPADLIFHGFAARNLVEGNVVEHLFIGDAVPVGADNTIVRNCLTSGPLSVGPSVPLSQNLVGNAIFGSDEQLRNTIMPPVPPQAPDPRPYLGPNESLFDEDGLSIADENNPVPLTYGNWYNGTRWTDGTADTPTAVIPDSYYGSTFAPIVTDPVASNWQDECAIPALGRLSNRAATPTIQEAIHRIALPLVLNEVGIQREE